MFSTVNDVKTITGKIVNAALIERAQYAIETYIGKFENDITNLKDIEILKRAVSYQAAYMLNNEDIVFEQVSVQTITQSDSSTTFKQGDLSAPFISPMSIMICKNLSFSKARSIKTGKILKSNTIINWIQI